MVDKGVPLGWIHFESMVRKWTDFCLGSHGLNSKKCVFVGPKNYLVTATGEGLLLTQTS